MRQTDNLATTSEKNPGSSLDRSSAELLRFPPEPQGAPSPAQPGCLG